MILEKRTCHCMLYQIDNVSNCSWTVDTKEFFQMHHTEQQPTRSYQQWDTLFTASTCLIFKALVTALLLLLVVYYVCLSLVDSVTLRTLLRSNHPLVMRMWSLRCAEKRASTRGVPANGSWPLSSFLWTNPVPENRISGHAYSPYAQSSLVGLKVDGSAQQCCEFCQIW